MADPRQYKSYEEIARIDELRDQARKILLHQIDGPEHRDQLQFETTDSEPGRRPGLRDHLADASTSTHVLIRSTATLERSLSVSLAKLVAAARLEGLTWEQIAEQVGVTRQAAHERWRRDEVPSP